MTIADRFPTSMDVKKCCFCCSERISGRIGYRTHSYLSRRWDGIVVASRIIANNLRWKIGNGHTIRICNRF